MIAARNMEGPGLKTVHMKEQRRSVMIRWPTLQGDPSERSFHCEDNPNDLFDESSPEAVDWSMFLLASAKRNAARHVQDSTVCVSTENDNKQGEQSA
jgi:hypothetical protein